MNTASLDSFNAELNQIREYLKHIHHVDGIANSDFRRSNKKFKGMVDILKKYYRVFGRDKKIFEYKATIISLYGLIEKYVEIWIKEYLDSLSRIIVDYNNVDENIRQRHFDLSLKLINTISSRESAKYQHLKKEQVLSKINDCISKPLSFLFNTEAFILLSGNLKHNKIVELFKDISVDLNERLKRNQALVSYIEDERQLSNIMNLSPDVLYADINELVDRRNLIAHGSDVIDDLLDKSILEPYINFLEKYCQAIFNTLLEESIKQVSIHNYKKIDIVHYVLKRGTVLCFSIENYSIAVGDFLITQTADNHFYKSPILEIQENEISYPRLIIESKKDIAVRVSRSFNTKCMFYLEKKIVLPIG